MPRYQFLGKFLNQLLFTQGKSWNAERPAQRSACIRIAWQPNWIRMDSLWNLPIQRSVAPHKVWPLMPCMRMPILIAWWNPEETWIPPTPSMRLWARVRCESRAEIGRASCRERVESEVVEVAV